jgi:hypothetical protein
VAKTPKVSLMVKCKVNRKWKNLPVQMSADGRIKAIPGGTLRYDRNRWESVGKDPDAAMAAERRWEISPEGITGVSVTDGGFRRTIDAAIAVSGGHRRKSAPSFTILVSW